MNYQKRETMKKNTELSNENDGLRLGVVGVSVQSFDKWFEKEGLYQLFNKSKRDTLMMRGFLPRTGEDAGWVHLGVDTHKQVAQRMVDEDSYCDEYVYLRFNRCEVEIFGRFNDWRTRKH